MTACFVYLRVSGLAQVEGEGFPRQLSACEEYARRNDLTIVKVFREEGVCGANELDNRPALQELIGELLADGVKTFLIEKLDRLARDLMVQESIIQDLQRKGIQVISTAEPDICSNDPTRVLIRQILGAFFQYERRMIVSKLADARRRIRAQNGKCEGRRGYGERPEERNTLVQMALLRQEGYTYATIASTLNQHGLKARNGGEWTAPVIAKILARQKPLAVNNVAPELPATEGK